MGADTMTILCPRHHLPLVISQAKFNGYSKKSATVIGKCALCHHFYINRVSSTGETTYRINWNTYEFLPALAFDYPVKISKSATSSHSLQQKGPSSKLVLPDSFKLEDIPDSTILVSQIYSHTKNIGTMGIVAEASDQKKNSGLFWVGRTLPSIVLATIAFNPKRTFLYQGTYYKIANNYQLLKNSDKYFDIISRFCNPESPQTVFVYSHKHISFNDQEDYEMVTAMVPCAKSTFPIPIQVYYDKKRKYYWLDEQIYDITRERYGLPYLRIYSISNYSSVFERGFHAFREVSDLKKFGYSVSEREGLTPYERQALLKNLIDQGLMWKHQIINHLTMLIKLNSKTVGMDNAVSE